MFKCLHYIIEITVLVFMHLIFQCRDLEHPTITSRPETVHENVKVSEDAYDACVGSHAIAVCTEWDSFKVMITQCIKVAVLQ